jgi:hypothetical protein
LFLTTLSLKTKLLALLGGSLALALLIGITGIISLRVNHASLETVYVDRVIPLQQLKSVSDDYAVLIIDAVNKANAGIMTSQEALESIRTARTRIAKTWTAYRNTYHTPEEMELSRQADAQFQTLEPLLNDLERQLASGGENRKSLLDAFDGPLYATMDPLTGKIQELVDLQLKVAEEEYVNGGKTYKSVSWGVGLAMGVGSTILMLAGGALTRHTHHALRHAIRELRAGAGQLSATADHLSQANQLIAQGASEQSGALEEIARTQQDATELTKENSGRAQVCAASIDGVLGSFSEAAENATDVSRLMSDIDASGKQMKAIMQMVEDIAFQTNILSLNASVEAARAGEHGRGFSVVADEVRSLALRSAEAAKKTSTIIEESARRSGEGTRKVHTLGGHMEQASRLAAQTKTEVRAIAAASAQQSQGAVAVTTAMHQLDQVAQSNAAAAEEGASASEELQAQFHSLLNVVGGLEAVMEGGQARRAA